MAENREILDIYSRREARAQGLVPDVYRYDEIPQALRVQVLGILKDLLMELDRWRGLSSTSQTRWAPIHKKVCHELGVLKLAPGRGDYESVTEDAAASWFILNADVPNVLDAIEVAFHVIAPRYWVAPPEGQNTLPVALRSAPRGPVVAPFIAELNTRFRQHGVGFQFEQGQIVREDSRFLHEEAIRPALALLNSSGYAGPNDEFLKAHAHYRHGRHKEAMTESLKAFESTMKSICAKRYWPHDARATAGTLIGIMFDKGLIEQRWESQFSALRATLESGVPTGRNQVSAHGQGATVVDVPPFIASYMLHLTGAAIVLLVEAEKALPT